MLLNREQRELALRAGDVDMQDTGKMRVSNYSVKETQESRAKKVSVTRTKKQFAKLLFAIALCVFLFMILHLSLELLGALRHDTAFSGGANDTDNALPDVQDGQSWSLYYAIKRFDAGMRQYEYYIVQYNPLDGSRKEIPVHATTYYTYFSMLAHDASVDLALIGETNDVDMYSSDIYTVDQRGIGIKLLSGEASYLMDYIYCEHDAVVIHRDFREIKRYDGTGEIMELEASPEDMNEHGECVFWYQEPDEHPETGGWTIALRKGEETEIIMAAKRMEDSFILQPVPWAWLDDTHVLILKDNNGLHADLLVYDTLSHSLSPWTDRNGKPMTIHGGCVRIGRIQVDPSGRSIAFIFSADAKSLTLELDIVSLTTGERSVVFRDDMDDGAELSGDNVNWGVPMNDVKEIRLSQ